MFELISLMRIRQTHHGRTMLNSLDGDDPEGEFESCEDDIRSNRRKLIVLCASTFQSYFGHDPLTAQYRSQWRSTGESSRF